MVFYSPHPDIVVPPLDLPTFLFSYAEKHSVFGTQPDLPAFIDDDVIISYAELKHMVTSFAAGLVNKLGLKPLDHIALVLPNTAFYGVLVLGAQMAGCVCVTTNPLYTSSELAHQFRTTQTKAVVTTMDNLATVRQGLKDAGLEVADSHLLTIDGNEDNFRRACSSKPFPHAYLATRQQVTSTPALVVFSSGTQGLPKGVQLSHSNVIANVLQDMSSDNNDERIAAAECERKPRTTIAVLPYFHCYALTMTLLTCVGKGYTQVVMRKFDVEGFCALTQQYKPTFAHLVPPAVLLLAKSPIVKKYDLSSLLYVNCGAAPMSPELQDEAVRVTQCAITNAYGLSEASPLTHRAQISGTPVGSVGFLMASMECKIVDDEGKELGVGEQGEICLRGPNTMMGYLNNPQATREAIDSDRFLHTGDIGYVDRAGYYYITDRKKELIKYKGFQVAPAELEGLLTNHPAVLDAAVIGVPDEKLATEVPKAFIVIRPDHKQAGIAQDVQEWVDDRVAYFKKLRGGIELVEEVPKSASGKILRRLLRDREAAKRSQQLKAKL